MPATFDIENDFLVKNRVEAESERDIMLGYSGIEIAHTFELARRIHNLQ